MDVTGVDRHMDVDVRHDALVCVGMCICMWGISKLQVHSHSHKHMHPCGWISTCIHVHACIYMEWSHRHRCIHRFVDESIAAPLHLCICHAFVMHLFICHRAPPLFAYLRTHTHASNRPYRHWRGTYVCILLIPIPRIHVCLYASWYMYVSVYASMYLCIRMYIYVWCGLVSRLM